MENFEVQGATPAPTYETREEFRRRVMSSGMPAALFEAAYPEDTSYPYRTLREMFGERAALACFEEMS